MMIVAVMRIYRLVLSLTAIAAMLAVVGCAAAPDQAATANTATPTAVTRSSSARTIGYSAEGRPIECYVFGDSGRTVLLIGSIHGNEPAGTPLLRMLIKVLRQDMELISDRRVVVVPVANPDGYVSKRRTNGSGVDLNRNFPAGNFRSNTRHGARALSEPESRSLLHLIEEHKPDRVLSIHQPPGCVDYDGPGRELAKAIAEAAHLPLRKLGGRPGSLGSYIGSEQIVPIITLELPSSASRLSDTAMWERYGNAVMVAIGYSTSSPDAR